MDKEKDRLEQAYTDRETETAQFILIDTNLPINLGEDGDRRLFGGRLKESLEKNDREIRFCRSCLLELKKHLQSADPEMARKAACGLQFVIDLYTQGCFTVTHRAGVGVDKLRRFRFPVRIRRGIWLFTRMEAAWTGCGTRALPTRSQRTRRWRCLNMAMCW